MGDDCWRTGKQWLNHVAQEFVDLHRGPPDEANWLNGSAEIRNRNAVLRIRCETLEHVISLALVFHRPRRGDAPVEHPRKRGNAKAGSREPAFVVPATGTAVYRCSCLRSSSGGSA